MSNVRHILIYSEGICAQNVQNCRMERVGGGVDKIIK